MNEQDRLLLTIEEHCDEHTGRYFVVPLGYADNVVSCERLRLAGLPYEVWVRGAGLPSRYAALVRKGLIEEVRPSGWQAWQKPAGYRITENGKLRTQSLA